jgi:hypothetical protein
MSERMEYQVALLKDGRFTNYETPSLFVDTDDEAIEKAKDWAHAFESAQCMASSNHGRQGYL